MKLLRYTLWQRAQQNCHSSYVKRLNRCSTLFDLRIIKREGLKQWGPHWWSRVSGTPLHHVMGAQFQFQTYLGLLLFGNRRNRAACPTATRIRCGMQLCSLIVD